MPPFTVDSLPNFLFSCIVGFACVSIIKTVKGENKTAGKARKGSKTKIKGIIKMAKKNSKNNNVEVNSNASVATFAQGANSESAMATVEASVGNADKGESVMTIENSNATFAQGANSESATSISVAAASTESLLAELAARGVKLDGTKKAVVNDDALIADIELVACDLSPVEFGKKVKPLSDAGIEKLATRANVRNMWAHLANPSIRRMRLIMELKATYYPQECGHLSAGSKTKTQNGFKAIPTEKLIAACAAKGLRVDTCANDKVNRMRATMLLKAFGATPEELQATL